jgi:hypothetical protein
VSADTDSPSIRSWAQAARQKCVDGALTVADFDALEGLLSAADRPRQRLLYLHAAEPNLFSRVIACNLVEPDADYEPQLVPQPDVESPYWAVLDAVRDGWHVIHFPQMEISAIESGKLGAIGFEFILTKPEVIR